jgi:HD-GYP domain-containing protein (c-di-GMP phosphodiesterase class II)
MTSDRPYRPRLSHAVAVERLRQGAGTQFDPILVGKLFEYLNACGDAEPQDTGTIIDWEFLEEFCPSM